MEKFKNALKSVNKFGLLLIFALGLFVITQSAFTNAKTDTYWVFDGNDISQVKDASQYHEDAGAPSCATGTALPCKLQTDVSINDETSLQTYLNTFPNDLAVRDAAIGKRN